MKIKVNWMRLAYRAIDYILSVDAATILWYSIDDQFAAAVAAPTFGHIPFTVVSAIFGAIRLAADTSGGPE